MITLPIIVLAALTGVSEGQTLRRDDSRQLAKGAKIVKEKWLSGQCQMGTSTRISNIPVKEDCIQECSSSSFVGINYNKDEKNCYCIDNLTTGKYYDFAHMDCFVYGTCGRLDEETCDISPLCSWNEEGYYCSKDSTGDDTPEQKKIQDKLNALRDFPKCSTKFNDKEIEPDTKCIDVNKVQCTKKQWDDYEHMCPGSEWEEVRCSADSSIPVGDSKTQDDCKTTCDKKGNIIAINFKINPENEKTECECITQGTLNQLDDENTKCYIYPESIEERCSAISEYSDCESDVWLKENCVPECGAVKEKLLAPPYVWEENDKLEPTGCVNVNVCNHFTHWEKCPTRCEQLFVASEVKDYEAPVAENDTAFMDAFEEQREIGEEMKNPATNEERREHLGKKAVCNILKNVIDELKDEVVEIGGEINDKFLPYFDAMYTNSTSKLAPEKVKVRQDLEQYNAKIPLTKTNDALIAEGICSEGTSDCIFKELGSGDANKIKIVAQKFVDPEVHESTGSRRRALQQRHLLITNQQAQDIDASLGHAINVFDLLDTVDSSGFFGSMSGLAQFGTPALAVLNHENTNEGRVRSAVELGLNAAQMFVPGPVGTLFKFLHQISIGVNGSDACTSEDGRRVDCNIKELKRDAAQIILTAGLETIGNGHATDLKAIVDIAGNIKSKGWKEGFNVKDAKTIGVAVLRTGCTIASFALPILAIPCAFGVKLGEILRDSPFGETERNEHALDNFVPQVLTAVHNVQKVVAGVVKKGVEVVQQAASYVIRGVEKFVKPIYNFVQKAAEVVGGVIGGALEFFGFGRKKTNTRPSQGRRKQQRPQHYRRRR